MGEIVFFILCPFLMVGVWFLLVAFLRYQGEKPSFGALTSICLGFSIVLLVLANSERSAHQQEKISRFCHGEIIHINDPNNEAVVSSFRRNKVDTINFITFDDYAKCKQEKFATGDTVVVYKVSGKESKKYYLAKHRLNEQQRNELVRTENDFCFYYLCFIWVIAGFIIGSCYGGIPKK